MKLSKFSKKYESRAKCAEALGVSYQHLSNLIMRDTEVAQLINGDWITLTKYNKTFKNDALNDV
jgi:hypothetical protein